jgi:hypothetical protein
VTASGLCHPLGDYKRTDADRGVALMNPIQIPQEWPDSGLITFEEFCALIRTPQRTVRDWRRRGIGPRWARFNGCGRLYITVAEARRFLSSAAPTRREERVHG